MSLRTQICQRLNRLGISPYHLLDWAYLPIDRTHIRRTKNIRLIPDESNRRGGKYSYAEWAHVIGIFQTLMYLQLHHKTDNVILDVGCGTGLLAIASEPFLGRHGKYVGIDVMERDIAFCRSHYPSPKFAFTHLDVANAAYAPSQRNAKTRWPIEDESTDLTTALSVWTHLNEEDALFYFTEIRRVLKPGGKAIVTLFLLDDLYQKGVSTRSHQEGEYHATFQDEWIFDQPSYGSDAWFHPKWVQTPENAIGVTSVGLDRLTAHAAFRLTELFPGNWKEVPGMFFQDILVFEKS